MQKQRSPLEQIDAITKIMSCLHDIRKGGIIYGLSDLEDFLRHDLDKIGYMLDDLRNELTAVPQIVVLPEINVVEERASA